MVIARSPRSRPARRRLGAAALAAAAAVLLAACTGSGGGAAGAGGGASSAPPPKPALAVLASLPFDAPATFAVAHGTLESATVTGHLHGTPLLGQIDSDGRVWTSDSLPTPGATYDVAATVKGTTGDEEQLSGRLVVAAVPAGSTLGFDITPFQGWTVGVNAPIVIRFHKPVEDRAAVERALTVSSSTPVVGAWHWINSVEVHFRTQNPWPAHTQIRVDAALDRVKAGPRLWGVTNASVSFQTGDVHLTKVDGKRHTLTVVVNGHTTAVWPTSLGRPEFATRTGSYIVLAKQPTRRMTSCNAHITCSSSNPNFYDLTVNWDVRLTYSGTFIHSAPWSVGAQGSENVSHGCVNLSPAHAQAYFNLIRYGDLVTVTGTSRGPADLLAVGDPGMTDYNVPWSTYVAGSALGATVTTTPLSGA